jgi:hypothetical protein
MMILGNHHIIFIAPKSLSLYFYQKTTQDYNIAFNVEFFEDTYFQGIDGYNQLMLTREFYARFSEYEYMLIYQLDAYVFRDELLDWCALGYDFIGAPSVGNWSDNDFSYNLVVGNGGFSLRKIKTYITAFDLNRNLLSAREIIKQYAVFKKIWTRIPLLLLMQFGFRNKLYYFASTWKYTEDDFWSKFLSSTNYSLTKPIPEKALEFAFERFPSNLFKITKKLPFGCHGWYKYEYEEFWKKHINEENK